MTIVRRILMAMFVVAASFVCSSSTGAEDRRASEPLEQQLEVVTWNIESGDNDPEVIARQLTAYRTYDIIALQEVNDANVRRYARALGTKFEAVISQTGSRFNDHLLLFYNREHLRLQNHTELYEYNGVTLIEEGRNTGLRAPHLFFFTDSATGAAFICINVHFTRGDAAHRCLQAFVLREWVGQQKDPVVALGDFNFDYDFVEERGEQPGNPAYHIFTYQDTLQWVRPGLLLDTSYSEHDGRETYPHQVLDFIFVANSAAAWEARSQIIKREGDFPDTEATSDHRPVAGVFTLP